MSDQETRGSYGTIEFPSVVSLNVGGKIFMTSLSTLRKYEDSMLGAMFSGRHIVDKDCQGNYFIDRDGTYFDIVLHFLRVGECQLPVNHPEAALKEAMFYGLQPRVELLKNSPQLFIDYAVKEYLQKKLKNYPQVKEELISHAKQQVIDDGALTSKVVIVTTADEPNEGNTFYEYMFYSLREHFGKYYIHLPESQFIDVPKHDPIMIFLRYVEEDYNFFTVLNRILNCLIRDLLHDGYKATLKEENVWDNNPMPNIIIESPTCHSYNFDWPKSHGS